MKKSILVILIMIVICIAITISYILVSSDASIATSNCITLCKNVKESNVSLELGPCLANPIVAARPIDWVCDVAHDPRLELDDLLENQCPEYIEGRVHHFVEVSPDCILIRAV